MNWTPVSIAPPADYEKREYRVWVVLGNKGRSADGFYVAGNDFNPDSRWCAVNQQGKAVVTHYCEMVDPKTESPGTYNWREHWQPTTRGGHEVVDVRPIQDNECSLLASCIWVCGDYSTNTLYDTGRYWQGQENGFDLLPIEGMKQ